jgi:serine/threonine-protein kinase
VVRFRAVVPQRIGRYEVLGQLATGGMAEILLARLSGPAAFARAVVIKRMLRQHAQKSSFVTMFLDEARTIAKIRHPNVVQVQELGEDAGEVFLVLEYVAGENLSSVLRRSVAVGERLEPLLVAHVIAEACAGLHAAHELVSDDGRHQNLVHRDVSPQNLFVAYDGHVKLLDFGVAITDERMARTEVGDVKGKFEYMSPEQARAEPLDRRSDIFAMGIVLYELGTGRRLFKRAMPARTLDAICTEPVIPPSRVTADFPPALEAIVLKALAKDPGERYATAAEMRAALLEVARGMTQPVEALAERMKRWFPERIAEKEEMLRRLADGDELSQIPAGEVDDEAIPNAPASPPVAARRRLPWPAILAAVVATVAIALGAARLGARSASAPPPAPDAAVAPAESVAVVEPPPPSPTDPAPADILVHVESRPPGARVLTDGTERGITPVDLRLARGATPVLLELRRAGFAPTTQSVVPDTDQKLVLSLLPASRRSGPRPGPTGAASGFRRFD